MANPRIAALIATKLSDGLVHPGDKQRPPIAIPLHAFRTAAIPPDQAQHFAADAGLPTSNITQLVAEAIVHAIETDGDTTLIANPDLAQLRQDAADAPDGLRTITVQCPGHNKPIIELTIGKTNQTKLPCSLLATALTAHQGATA